MQKKKDLVEPVDRQVFRGETNSCLNGNDKRSRMFERQNGYICTQKIP